MMKNIFNFFLSVFIVFLSIENSYCQGLIFMEDEDFDQIDTFEGSDFGFADVIPEKYSLEKFVPPVLDQGEQQTCVGFAVAYYALSTMHNIYFNRTSFYEKTIHAFDPHYAYSLGELSEKLLTGRTSNCYEEGIYMREALDIFSDYGAKKRFYQPLDLDCIEKPLTDEIIKEMNYLKPYRLGVTKILTNSYRTIDDIKIAVSQNYPVVIGTNLTESFQNVKSGSNEESFWIPKGDEELLGGHAMCVVGYDNNLNGGSFRIVNSWGPEWGDDGYFWISYKDFNDYVYRAYTLKPYELDFEEINEYVYYFDDYKAFSFKEISGNYEGFISEEGYLNGLGIVIDNEKKYGSVGNFVNGIENGKHLHITNDGFYGYEYDMGVVINEQKFGFAGGDESLSREIGKYGNKMLLKTLNRRQIDSINKMGGVGKWKIRKPNESLLN